MLLIKCKCGCFFTVKDDWFEHNRRHLSCQNCDTDIPLDPYTYISDLKLALEKAGAVVSAIPENGKMSVSFDA